MNWVGGAAKRVQNQNLGLFNHPPQNQNQGPRLNAENELGPANGKFTVSDHSIEIQRRTVPLLEFVKEHFPVGGDALSLQLSHQMEIDVKKVKIIRVDINGNEEGSVSHYSSKQGTSPSSQTEDRPPGSENDSNSTCSEDSEENEDDVIGSDDSDSEDNEDDVTGSGDASKYFNAEELD